MSSFQRLTDAIYQLPISQSLGHRGDLFRTWLQSDKIPHTVGFVYQTCCLVPCCPKLSCLSLSAYTLTLSGSWYYLKPTIGCASLSLPPCLRFLTVTARMKSDRLCNLWSTSVGGAATSRWQSDSADRWRNSFLWDVQRLWVIWGQCCLTVAASPCLPNSPITQLSPYFTQNPCT